MMAVVKPYICSVCKDVFNVLVGEHGEVFVVGLNMNTLIAHIDL